MAGAGPEDHRAAAERDQVPVRTIHQLRCALPLGVHATVETRRFDPEGDVDPWLVVNNRAFSWHPEQGGWDRKAVADRMAEPWFDPNGFLLHERAGTLAAFCWTKVHADHDPPLGEIYVIGVDPAFQGQGLGRELTLAGLDHLSGQGVTVGMLYVESDNEAAVALYRSLGFVVHRDDVFFGPAPDGTGDP